MQIGKHPVRQWNEARQRHAEQGMDLERFLDLLNLEWADVLGRTTRHLFIILGNGRIATRRLSEYEDYFQSWTKVEYDGENASEVYRQRNLDGQWEMCAAETRGDIIAIHEAITESLQYLRRYSSQPELRSVVELHKMILDDVIETTGFIRPKTHRRGRPQEPKNIFKMRS